jgi:hypothetical protein
VAAPPIPLRRNPVAAAHELADAGGAVVLNVASGDYYGLNRMGTLVWSLIDGSRTETALVGELAGRFAAAPGQLEADVARFVAELRKRQLLL